MAPLHSLLYYLSLLSLSFTTVTLAQSPTLATATAIATTNPSPPPCAQSCIQRSTESQTCTSSDQTCLCSQATQIQELVATCLETSTCSDEERAVAIDYYPEYCQSLNLAVETAVPTAIATAGSTAPARVTAAGSNLAVTSTTVATQTTTITPDSANANKNMTLPAILGITLAAILLLLGFISLIVWSTLRRRYVRRGPRKDLGDELVNPQPRPQRSLSINSDFVVQPSPIEKDEVDGALSRTSTLVAPPPIAKDDKRSSDDKRNSARNRTLNILLGADRLRSSFLSSISSTKKSSLIVPPLNINKAQEEELRISKF